MNDRACLWTWERMLLKTSEYCVWRDSVDGKLFSDPIWIGWWVSDEAVEDMDWFECPN